MRRATEAFEEGTASCEICKRPLAAAGKAGRGGAALLALVSASESAAVLTHIACRSSQVMYVEGERTDSPHLDAVNHRWHAVVREPSPGALFIWETLTHIHGTEGDLQLDVLRQLGFQKATGPLETLRAPRARYLTAFYRPDAFCFSLNGGELQAHEPFAPGIWTARATRERRVLVVYGTNLGLKDFDPEHVNARIADGVVVAATVPFAQRDR